MTSKLETMHFSELCFNQQVQSIQKQYHLLLDSQAKVMFFAHVRLFINIFITSYLPNSLTAKTQVFIDGFLKKK